MKKHYYKIEINAPSTRVYSTMINSDSYMVWASVFSEGTYFEGSWDTNEKIKFLTTEGLGMYSEIAKNIPNEYISIRHLGMINKGGIIDTESDEVKNWVNALENYTFKQNESKTELFIDIDVTAEAEDYMNEAWPKALAKLKELCES